MTRTEAGLHYVKIQHRVFFAVGQVIHRWYTSYCALERLLILVKSQRNYQR